MQTLALLWFELQIAQQYLREIFAQSQVADKTRNLNSPSIVGLRCCASVEPVQLPPPRPHSQWQIPRGAAHKWASKVNPVEVRNAAKTTYRNAHVTYERDQKLRTEMVILKIYTKPQPTTDPQRRRINECCSTQFDSRNNQK